MRHPRAAATAIASSIPNPTSSIAPGAQIFASPLRVDGDWKIQPYLAESWEFSSDQKTLTLKLRQGVKFHSGREFTSADVKHSVEFGQTNEKVIMRTLYRAIKQDIPEEDYTVPLGKAQVVQEGSDITLISWGSMFKQSMDAVAKMNSKYSVELIDLRTISPLDEGTIIASVKKTGRCVVVHEAPKTCGFAAEIIAQINEKALLSLQAPVERVTSPDVPFPMSKLENYYFPSQERIVKGIEKVMSF